jgi:hypothetical protein
LKRPYGVALLFQVMVTSTPLVAVSPLVSRWNWMPQSWAAALLCLCNVGGCVEGQ